MSLVYTIVMPLSGRVSEILGRRVTFIGHVVFFTAGSLLCTVAPNIYVLIAARIMQ